MKSSAAEWSKASAKILARMLLLVLLAPLSLRAQRSSLDVSQYLHSSWTAQQGYFRGIGVSNNGIAQTRDGYVWILSPTGVFRFDGERFVEWTPPNGEPFPGSPPSQLLASRDGSLWIAGHGVAQLRADGTWHRYHELDALSRVRLAEERDGVIWVAGETSPTPTSLALFSIDNGKVGPYRSPELAGQGFAPLFVDKEGRLWGDSEKGIWKLLPGSPELVVRNTVRSPVFSEDSSGSLLYSQAGRIRKLADDGTSTDFLGELQKDTLNIRAMLRDREGGLWIGTNGQGIIHLHEEHIDHFSSLDGLSSDIVESIFQDREGNVWVTSPESIDKFSKPAVPKLTRKQGLSGDSIQSVLIDQHSRTWIGTSNGFNEIVADHVGRIEGQAHNDPSLATLETRTGRLVMTTQSRDQAITPKHGQLISGVNEGTWVQGYKNLFSFAEDNDGTLWAASQQLGLLHLRANGDLVEVFSNTEWDDYPLSVLFDRKRDGIWFTTHNGRLVFQKDGKIAEKYGQNHELGDLSRLLKLDDDGGLWIASPNGLAHLNDHKLSILGVENGLPCGRVHWMRTDEDHNVWVYTACGLVSFSQRDLSSWITDPSYSVKIMHYLDNTEGVENTAIGGWYTPQSAMMKDGRILFATRTGLGMLDPRHLNQNDLPPPVHVEGITADGREIAMQEQVALPARTGAIHIAYTALSFVAPRKVLFRYKLQGYDKDWSRPVSLREVTYTNLPPGKYRFQVIACNNNGVWNSEGATLSFFVEPSWYQTLWFRLLAILVILSLLTAFYLGRIGLIEREMNLRFEERMTERMRISRELHDTLLQSLQGLALSFSSFSSRVTATPEVLEEMEHSLDRVDQLVISGRERIRDLRGESTKLIDLTTALSTAVYETLGDLGPTFNVEVKGTPRPLHEVVQEEAVWIVREALANARQHSGAETVQLLVSFQDGEFGISVHDSGRGFRPDFANAPRDGHFGMIGMRERAEAIGGHLSVRSSPGEGTTIELIVPGKVVYKELRGWWSRLMESNKAKRKEEER